MLQISMLSGGIGRENSLIDLLLCCFISLDKKSSYVNVDICKREKELRCACTNKHIKQ